MSPAATTYLLKEDGTLNHGHTTQGSPTIVQWHRATAYHRDDPHAHSRCDSWNTQSEWSRRSASRTRAEREQLILDAQRAHDAGATLPPSRPTTVTATATTQYAAADTGDTAMHAHEVPASSTVEGDADLGQAILKQIATRLDDVEEAAVTSLTQASQAKDATVVLDTQLQNTRSAQTLIAGRVDAQGSRIDALEAAAERKVTYEVRSAAGTTTLSGTHHKKFAELVELMSNLDPEDRNVWITGPAGSGKTTGARNLAKLLFGSDNIKVFYRAQGAIASPFQITGFMNAGGTYVGTPFRHIYENGGVILLDECDGSSANALLEINGATANGEHSFPDQMVTRHPDCYILAAANTWGFGGDANYMGRNKLDDATLDRFLTLDWGYDYELEAAIAPHAEWCKIVQAARRARDLAGAKVLITPRATLKGGKLLNGGVKPALVVEAIFGRNRDKDGKLPAFLQPAEAWAKNYTRPTTTTTPRTQASPPLPTPINSVNFSGVR